jgi:CDP-glucose 4,6-dehydratase
MSFWKDKKVVVTGGMGLMGTPMVAKLESLGAEVFVADLPRHDITNFGEMMSVMQGQDICIHLAAMSNVEQSRSRALESLHLNIGGTINVLEACRQREVGTVVTASSNHVYGGPQNEYDGRPLDEHARLKQLDVYSVSKICADYLTRSYWHNFGLKTSAMRNTNCFGPADPHISHIIPGTIQTILKNQTPIIQSSGEVKKGYLYVDDVVDAYLLVAEATYMGTVEPGLSFNVGASPISAKNLVRIIMDIMGQQDSMPTILDKPNDQVNENLDSSRIQALGWEPKYSLTEGLEKTIEFFRDRVAV